VAKDIRQLSSVRADQIGLGRFARAQHDKLALKRGEGRHGWNLPRYFAQADRGELTRHYGVSQRGLQQMLRNHIKRGLKGSNLVDVANFCMMLWNREHPFGVSRAVMGLRR